MYYHIIHMYYVVYMYYNNNTCITIMIHMYYVVRHVLRRQYMPKSRNTRVLRAYHVVLVMY